MRFLTAPFLALPTLVSVLALLVLVPGCAKQDEGERCGDTASGPETADCDEGLTCVAKDNLLNNATHRCCYTDGHVSDSRCERSNSSVPAGGSGGGGGGDGASEEAGSKGG